MKVFRFRTLSFCRLSLLNTADKRLKTTRKNDIMELFLLVKTSYRDRLIDLKSLLLQHFPFIFPL